MRRTLNEARKSLLAANLGYCQGDIPNLAAIINQAQEQLIYASGETGFWGGWWRTVFNVYNTYPYISCPREVARIAEAAVCTTPVRIQNEWYEFMEAGVGPRTGPCTSTSTLLQLLDRGFYPTAYDMPGSQYVRAYFTDTKDRGKRVLVDGLDQNGYRIQSVDGENTVQGVYLTLTDPFDTTTLLVSSIRGVQKDETFGDVTLYSVDPDTGGETFLARYGPRELVPSLRRYYIENLPTECCSGVGYSQINAMCKLEFIPAWRDTDFLIIGNLPALIEECRSIRHANMDQKEMKELSLVEHRNAVKHLNDELRHYLGSSRPAVTVQPFGSAKLSSQRIGKLM